MNRLSGRAAFQRLFQQGVKIRGGSLRMMALPNGLREVRIGWVIQRKAQLSGVKRNRYKRWLREAFRRPQEKCPAGLDLAIVVSKPPMENSFHEVQKSILNLLEKLELKRNLLSGLSKPTSGSEKPD